jgi:predicted AAA+ superfamily ATPase
MLNISEDKIKEIILTWEDDIRKTVVFRRVALSILESRLNEPVTDVLLGVRRCGKTYLMYSLFQKLKDAVYINFEDERLAGIDAGSLDEIYRLYLGLKKPERPVMFLDEIQNVPGWEKFVSRLQNKVKFVISGSNASMLSSEFATALTGRYLPFEVFPLSFGEFVFAIENHIPDIFITGQKARIETLFSDYVNYGGFPLASLQKNSALLKAYFESILFRDIIPRFAIQNIQGLEMLSRYMISNPGKLFSYRNLTEISNVKHEETVKNYIHHLEKAYLLQTITKFDYSLRKQAANQKKAYPIDTGFVNHAGKLFSDEAGRLLETIVFTELRRRGYDIFYWKDSRGKETDFVVCNGLNPRMLIQVTERITSPKQLERETDALLEAENYFNTGNPILITRSDLNLPLPENIKHYQCINWLLQG